LKILSIQRVKFHVGAVIQQKGDGSLACSLLDDFDNLEAVHEAARDRFLAYFGQVAANGPRALNGAQMHQVDANDKIYELIAGGVRVLYFQGTSGQVIICTHMFLKKSQKTPPKEIARAVRAKKEYEQATKAGLVEWKEEI